MKRVLGCLLPVLLVFRSVFLLFLTLGPDAVLRTWFLLGLAGNSCYAAIAPGAHATERFLAQAARLIRFSDIANVAAFFGVSENTLARWYYDYVERQQKTPPANLKPIKSLGIDELSLKKNTGSSSR